ncbi:MAG: hypothetical protein QW550_06320, partial [Saccharolobus sp.]
MRFQSLLKKSFTFFLFFILISLVLISINFVPNSLNISNIAKGQISSSSGYVQIANLTFSGQVSAGEDIYFTLNYSKFLSDPGWTPGWVFTDVNGNPMYAWVESVNTNTQTMNIWLNCTFSSTNFNILLWNNTTSSASGYMGYSIYSAMAISSYDNGIGVYGIDDGLYVFPFYFSAVYTTNLPSNMQGTGYVFNNYTYSFPSGSFNYYELTVNGSGSPVYNYVETTNAYNPQNSMLLIYSYNSSFYFTQPSGTSGYPCNSILGFVQNQATSTSSGSSGNTSILYNRWAISGTQFQSVNGVQGPVFTSGPSQWVFSAYQNSITAYYYGLGDVYSGLNISALAYNLGSNSQYWVQNSSIISGVNMYAILQTYNTVNAISNIVYIIIANVIAPMPTLLSVSTMTQNLINFQLQFYYNNNNILSLYGFQGTIQSNIPNLNGWISSSNGYYNFSMYTNASLLSGTITISNVSFYINNQWIMASSYQIGYSSNISFLSTSPNIFYYYNSSLNAYLPYQSYSYSISTSNNMIIYIYIDFFGILPFSIQPYPYTLPYNFSLNSVNYSYNGWSFSQVINYNFSLIGFQTIYIFSEINTYNSSLNLSSSYLSFSTQGIFNSSYSNYQYYFDEYSYSTGANSTNIYGP